MSTPREYAKAIVGAAIQLEAERRPAQDRPSILRGQIASWLDRLVGPEPGERMGGAGGVADYKAEALWLLAGELEAIKGLVAEAQAAVAALRVRDIEENGAIRFGDTAYTASTSGALQLAVPATRIVGWAKSRGIPLERLWRLGADNLRITAWRAEARREAEETVEPEAVDDYLATYEATVFTRPERPAHLAETPITKAQWAQALRHGQRRSRRRGTVPDGETPAEEPE